MANREQRRAAKKLQKHPLIKAELTEMAMSMANMMFDETASVMQDLQSSKSEEEILSSKFTPEMEQQWKQKGMDMATHMKNLTERLKGTVESKAKELNIQDTNTIKNKIGKHLKQNAF